MRPLNWRRATAFGVGVMTAVLMVVAVRLATACYEREFAERSAATIAAYLSVATPPDQGGSEYDLAQILIQARALAALLGSSRVEVFHGTAPLVHAIAQPLYPAQLDLLRREEMTMWDGETALAPLRDREGWNVVGAVRVPRARLAIRWLEWGLPALLLIALVFGACGARLVGGPALQERALAAYAAAALLAGCAAYIDVRTAAKRATDRWLAETGALVQEVTTHASGRVDPADIASIVRGGTLVPAGIAGWDSKPRRMNRGTAGSIVVRVGAGRWAELRTPAAEAATGVWLVCIFCLALLGPAAVRITSRGEP